MSKSKFMPLVTLVGAGAVDRWLFSLEVGQYART